VGAYLTRRVGRAVAEDLLGEVWVAAFGSRARYDRSYPDARPWLFGVALNCLRRYWRSRSIEDLLDCKAEVEAGWDPWPSVDGRIAVEAALRRALRQLPPDEQEILTLVVWEELSIADAARTLGIPAGTARRCLHQARLALRSTPGIVALLTESRTVKETK
jgi:RNA polymerase sigma factor (sigma-70 family)